MIKRMYLVDIFDIKGWSHSEDKAFYDRVKAHDFCVQIHKKDKNLIASFRDIFVMDDTKPGEKP